MILWDSMAQHYVNKNQQIQTVVIYETLSGFHFKSAM